MPNSRRLIVTATGMAAAVGCFYLGLRRVDHYDLRVGFLLAVVIPILLAGFCVHVWTADREPQR